MKWLVVLISSLSVACCVTIAEARPKIGLVLGGGGAAGVSHVGVLKVLEQNNIPIDVIAGNSMGAIVGSLYASGMKVEDIEKTAQTLDWLSLFSDGGAYKGKSYEQKQQQGGFFSALTMGVSGKGVKLPSGLVTGQRLTFELRRLLAPVAHINNFDNLPIPFRAVATDINTGETVVLKSGNLATAVRASMSIPGLFNPVEIDGHLLVDGLVSNNLPVDIARQMGADIVIVSSIPPGKPLPLDSALNISLQSMDLLVRRTSEAQLKSLTSSDILIRPPIGDIGNLDFDRAKEVIPLGEKGALAQLAAIRRLSRLVGIDPNAKNVVAHQKPNNIDKFVVGKVKIDNGSVLSPEILYQKLNIKEGQALNAVQLQAALDRVYSLGQFGLVDYALEPRADGKYDLQVMANKADQGNRRLNFGFSLSDDFNGDTRYQAGVKFVNKGLTRKGTEVRAQGVIGEQILASAELYHPFQDRNASFIAPKIAYQEGDVKLLSDGQAIAELRARTSSARIDVGRAVGKNQQGEVRAGVFWEHLSPKVKTGSLPVGTDAINSAGLQLQYAHDTFDSIDFPTFGSRVKVDYSHGFKQLGSDSNFNRLRAEGEKVWPLSDTTRLTANGRLSATTNNAGSLIEAQEVLQAGRLALADNTRLQGNFTLEGSVGVIKQVVQIPQVSKVNVGASLGVAQVWQKRSDVALKDLEPSASVYIGATTPIGPAFLGVRKIKGYDHQAYFNFGRNF